MKVIHSCTSRSFSGLEQYVLQLASWQHKQGKSVELFCRKNSILAVKAHAAGVPLWTIDEGIQPGPILWLKMRKHYQNISDAVLHMHAGGEPWFHLPWILRKARNLNKIILHYHIWINHKKKDPLHHLIFSAIDEIWTSSESARSHLTQLLPVHRDAIRVVRYGRNVKNLIKSPIQDWRKQVREQLNLSHEDVLGLCISRLEPIKGIGELFSAFVQVAPKFKNAHLMIIGDPSPDNLEAERFSKNLQNEYLSLPIEIKNRLHLVGYHSEVFPKMAAADFYVLPSYEECMSLAMLDALILGLPVAGTSSGGTPSVVRPNETGYLFPPKNIDGLAKTLENIYAHPDECVKLKLNAQALGKEFDQERIFLEIWNQYQ